MIHYTRRSISPPPIEKGHAFSISPAGYVLELGVDRCRNVAIPVRSVSTSASSITTS
jgi:hypothetical protein